MAVTFPIWTQSKLEAVLGRKEYEIPVEEPLARLAQERVLITGAEGSLGSELLPWLASACIEALATDIENYDVRRPWAVSPDYFAPTLVFHLAGAKHAPHGELDPWTVIETNTLGTRNVLDLDGRVVLASTCKAADPETVYGASKLLAERMVLNAGGSIARFYNVVEASGNVFETWSALPEEEPLRVANCYRSFISLREAVALLLWAAVLPRGRYTLGGVHRRYMPQVAIDLYPEREREPMKSRRGDRRTEPNCAQAETILALARAPWPLVEIRGKHDPR